MFAFFGKFFVKLKRVKAFYAAKVDADLGFLAKARSSAEESEEEESIWQSPCVRLSHFVNRLEEAVHRRPGGARPSEMFSKDFLKYSVKDEAEKDPWDFSFDLSNFTSNDQEGSEGEDAGGSGGFLKLNTIDHGQSSAARKKGKSAIRGVSTKLEFFDEPSQPKDRRPGAEHSGEQPDFIGFSEFGSRLTEGKGGEPAKDFLDFENIFEQPPAGKGGRRSTRLEFVSRERVRKSTNRFNSFATLQRKKDGEVARAPRKSELRRGPGKSESLLPDFDNGTLDALPGKKPRQASVDFLA